ncbi:MAG: bifunctional 5,10-methylenetetrahydrofolate dehydrogenase/5,10-methenyltetrahydrofolate cyclohydrolase [Candidatus Dormibacteraeota bacterium]|nr:bifunctional 5,10-methylenetetrahydrofolate dehydrogenase/5,10-methenyltetrahydrofolate cyclohydrolase [Candidatus Dormibacteraeota bacterium]MBV8445376.1 bifunctional 5,10-methylenetetrahydrofolate dehydrogenase/5,10-methenyltetrahydrofolate cyclohydrolase [Candidatus Dormibacteraeota bacterium]
MSAVLIDGRAVAASVRDDVAEGVRAFTDSGAAPPKLAVVLCGNNAASAMYVRNKGRAAQNTGIVFELHTPAADTPTQELVSLVRRLREDESVDAILVQLPLPPQVDTQAVVDAVPPEKDADGFHPLNLGRLAEGRHVSVAPCTPLGCMELLHRYKIPVGGSRAVVLGRSIIVGRPMALLLTNADATVTVCHSKTRDLAAVTREADIVVAAIGRPRMVTGDFVKPGACVIDVGTTPGDSGPVGDVDRATVEPVAGWLTPVPGGVGPMTIAMLLRNTLSLARSRRGG